MKHHSKDNIANDIRSDYVNILLIDDYLVGTGSYKDNHITRVFVRPYLQGQGYGSYIMQRLEEEIALNYDVAYLDSSLPASSIYEHRGYKTIKHEKWLVENDAVLVYEIMVKPLAIVNTNINYK